jgi:hypothetical protein
VAARATKRKTAEPKVATEPSSGVLPDDAHVVDDPPTSGEGRSTDTPTDEQIDLDTPSFLRRKQPP